MSERGVILDFPSGSRRDDAIVELERQKTPEERAEAILVRIEAARDKVLGKIFTRDTMIGGAGLAVEAAMLAKDCSLSLPGLGVRLVINVGFAILASRIIKSAGKRA